MLRYVLYLEDDWELLDPIRLSDGWKDLELGLPKFFQLLNSGMQILAESNSIVQVLMNEQSQRSCSLGMMFVRILRYVS